MPSDIDVLERRFKDMTLRTLRTQANIQETALELFELASAKEQAGLLTDAAGYYQKAYKLDEKVDLRYRERFVQSLPPLERRKEGIPQVDYRFRRLDLSKIRVRRLLGTFRDCEFEPLDPGAPVRLRVLPNELLLRLLKLLLVLDPAGWLNFSMSCKKLAYLGFYDRTVWKTLARLVYGGQVYKRDDDDHVNYRVLIRKQWGGNWLKMLNERPFLKYMGVYVSTVINQIEGGRSEFSSSWNLPFRMLTYYRYLRFFQDGTCLKFLTILEPRKVIPKLYRNWSQLLDEEDDKKEWTKVYRGRFSLTLQGDVTIESEGPYKPWEYVDKLKIVNGGRHSRHHKLEWVEMTYREREGDGEGEFGLQGEKQFVFSRVDGFEGVRGVKD